MPVEERPKRRMGSAGSESWHAMLDGCEQILRDEGHAALTSRRVADRIGVKQRLIYYYFQTMDELVVHTFHRLAERELQRLTAAARAPQPLRAIWGVSIHTVDVRLVAEFIAMANRIEPLQVEVIEFIEASRRIQTDAIAAALRRSAPAWGQAGSLEPAALAILASSAALTLTREQQLGVCTGHAETRAVLAAVIAELEPATGS